MKIKTISLVISCALSFSGLAAQPQAEHYIVSFPEGTRVSYSGAFASAFPDGLPVGIGSGLLFTGKQGMRSPSRPSPIAGRMPTHPMWANMSQKFSSRQTSLRC